ncbi:hypothetical protein JCM11251_000617 [Rhodosporidiobolus azoricus]
MSSSYADAQSLYAFSAPFEPFLPTTSLSSAAVFCLTLCFVLSFYFSTLRSTGKNSSALPVELGVAAMASVVGGFGTVLFFCTVGANV